MKGKLNSHVDWLSAFPLAGEKSEEKSEEKQEHHHLILPKQNIQHQPGVLNPLSICE